MNKNDNFILVIFFIVIVLTNFQLFYFNDNYQYCLHVPSILEGEIWRIFSHPFAHLSFYHLTTDILVFLVLFRELKCNAKAPIYLLILVCWVVSSFSAMISLSVYGISTFGGLSGINYGLLMYFCIYQGLMHENRKVQIIFFLISLLLILSQLLGGFFQVQCLQNVHYGYVGSPILESHAGGILAGLIFIFLQIQANRKNIIISKIPFLNRLNRIKFTK